MTETAVIVTDTGFQPDDWTGDVVAPDALAANAPARAVDLASDTDPETLKCHLGALDLIRIDFPSFADGRGFTLARRLRLMGYAGRLRARGHVIADQYAMIRRAGFDEVEISEAMSYRQPEDHWLRRADWQAHDYQARLRG